MTIPDTIEALRRKAINREQAIDLLVPELDRLLAFELLPVVGGFAEALSDQFLRPMAGGIVNAAQARWAKERRAARVAGGAVTSPAGTHIANPHGSTTRST